MILLKPVADLIFLVGDITFTLDGEIAAPPLFIFSSAIKREKEFDKVGIESLMK